MSKQCPSCGGDCGYTKKHGCQYSHAAKVDRVATDMIELPLKLIKAILHKHETSVIEVMGEQVKQYNDLVDRILAGTNHAHIDDWLKENRP